MNSSAQQPVSRIAVTPGEPAGIGPDIVVALAAEPWPVELVAVGDPDLLRARARLLGSDIEIVNFDQRTPAAPSRAGRMLVAEYPLPAPSTPGKLNVANSVYVVDTLSYACDGCRRGEFAAMLTAPVHKGIINDAGIAFTGHTEFLAQRCGVQQPVMLLVAGNLRVALVTTHLPLRDVADAISVTCLRHTTRILNAGLTRWFGISEPRITVLGLNPHAGESGHLGDEEQRIIEPVVEELRGEGLRLIGPLPADTAFTEHHLDVTDAVLAMYHDQGLPVLKHRGFGRAVNVTLGLPIIRTSVDHGTALNLAGSGRADSGSLRAALELAIAMQSHATR